MGKTVPAHKQEYSNFKEDLHDKMPQMFDDVDFLLHKSSDVRENSQTSLSVLCGFR